MTSPTSLFTQTSPTTSATSASSSPQSRIPTRLLNQDDFLKLVVVQLANQDPTKPQTDTEFIGQMTQFTALEQTKNMTADIAQMRAQQQIVQGLSLLNREVEVHSGKSDPVTGVVTDLVMDGDTPKLLIGGKPYDLHDVVNIRLASQN